MAEEGQVERSNRVDGARRALPVDEASSETADMPLGGVDRELEMPAKPPTFELLSEEGIEVMTPLTLDDAELKSSRRLETVGVLNILWLQTARVSAPQG